MADAALPKPAVMIAAAGVAAVALVASVLVLRRVGRGRRDPARLLPKVDVAAYNDFVVGP